MRNKSKAKLALGIQMAAFGVLASAAISAEVQMQLTGKLPSSSTIYSGSVTVDPGATVSFSLTGAVTNRTGTTGQLAYCAYDVNVVGGNFGFQVTTPLYLAYRGQTAVAGQWFVRGDIDKNGFMNSHDWLPFLRAFDMLLADDDDGFASDLNSDGLIDEVDVVLLNGLFGGAGLSASAGTGRFENITALYAWQWQNTPLTLQPFRVTMPSDAAPGTRLRVVVTPVEALIGNNGVQSESAEPLSFVAAQVFTGASFEMIVPGGSCVGDLTHDNQVDDADFVQFAVSYNLLDCLDPQMTAGCPADFDHSGTVDDADFVIFVVAYNELVCP